jgi:hypothetical protein
MGRFGRLRQGSDCNDTQHCGKPQLNTDWHDFLPPGIARVHRAESVFCNVAHFAPLAIAVDMAFLFFEDKASRNRGAGERRLISLILLGPA